MGGSVTCATQVGLALLTVGLAGVEEAHPDAVQQRMAADLRDGNPIVVHLTVALCDNAHQGIVPVPAQLGDGQDPKSNLYWGALYGVRTHLIRAGGWKPVPSEAPTTQSILERVVLKKQILRAGRSASVYIVADAWDGAEIRATVTRFLAMAAGRAVEPISADSKVLRAGGGGHLVAYVGHNGLMDFGLPAPSARRAAPARDALVLACASKPYFLAALEHAGASPLLLTTGLMAPEAYTLDAAVGAWAAGVGRSQVREAAAHAYHAYQKCGLRAARRLFWSSVDP